MFFNWLNMNNNDNNTYTKHNATKCNKTVFEWSSFLIFGSRFKMPRVTASFDSFFSRLLSTNYLKTSFKSDKVLKIF